MTARLRRIRLAARTWKARRPLVKKCVLPCITWVGAWCGNGKDDLFKLRMAIEKCVEGRPGTGYIIGRSRCLMWVASLGTSLDPGFLMDLRAIGIERRALCKAIDGEAMPHGRGSRLKTIMTSWAGANFPWGDTRRRREYWTWGGTRELQQLLSQPRRWWLDEPRVTDEERALTKPDTTGISFHPNCHEARKLSRSADYAVRRQAVGAAYDSRAMRGSYKSLRLALPDSIVCMCGTNDPSRRHLTWNREAGNAIAVEPLRWGGEEGLITRVTPFRPRLSGEVDGELVTTEVENLLRRAADNCNNKCILVATDGGGIGRTLDNRYASVGIAVDIGGGIAEACGACVPGVDQTPGTAEKWNALIAVVAASRAGVGVTLLIDNWRIMSMVRNLMAGAIPTNIATMPSFWKRVQTAVAALPQGCQCHWVPSHDTRKEWEPPRPHDTTLWRRLNAMADEQASKFTARCYDRSLPERQSVERCKKWESTARRRFIMTSKLLADKYPFQYNRE